MTFLSILASNAIALPLAASFPSPELRYILNNAEAAVFLTSEKHYEKAQDVLKEDVEIKPAYVKVDKILAGSKSVESVTLEDDGGESKDGGMMLYTSGTTSRPVSLSP